MIRLGAFLRRHSASSHLVFVTLPLPTLGLPARHYMGWLEMLTHGMPPTVLIRGNGEDVLTLYS